MKHISILITIYFLLSPAHLQAQSAAESPQSATTTEPKKASAPQPAKENTDKEKKKDKDETLKVKARIHTRWVMEHEQDDPETEDTSEEELDHELKIQRARVKFVWEPKDWVMGVIQVGGFHRVRSNLSFIKDAYIHLSPLRYLEIRVGQFKRPFSRLELRGSSRMRTVDRGIGNSFIVETYDENGLNGEALAYGDRDLGLQISGRLVKSVKLDYELGVFNGTGPNDTPLRLNNNRISKDVVARLKLRPSKWFRVGTNISLKFFDDDETFIEVSMPTDDSATDENVPATEQKTVLRNPGWAAGIDALFRIDGFRLHLEGLLARDYRAHLYEENEDPIILNLVGIASYRHKFDTPWKLAVEPVFKMEVLDPNSIFTDDIILVFTPGLNVYFGDYFRLMLHGNIQRVSKYTDASLPNAQSEEELILQFCFDI